MKNQANLLSKWILVSLVILISVGLALLGYLFFTNQQKAIREVNNNQLSSIGQLKVDQIVRWRAERMGDLRVVSESSFFSGGVEQYLQNPEDSLLLFKIAGRLETLRTNYGYANAMIVSTDGSFIVTLKPRVRELETETLQLVRQVIETKTAVFGDYFRSSLDDQVYIDLVAPILDQDRQTIAVMILRVDPNEYLYPLVQSWPTPSQSGETLLVRRDGDAVQFLNSLRHRDDPPLTIRLPLSREDLPAVQAVLGKTGSTDGNDYRGEPVFATLQSVPNTSWFLVSKIDQSEIIGQVVFVGQFILLIVVFAVLFTISLMMVIFNNRQRRLYQNLYQVEEARRNALEQTRTILYSIGDGVIATDQTGRVTHFNPIAEDLTGWTEAEASGRDLSEVFKIVNEVSGETVENPVHRVLREGTIVGLANHTLLIKRDGSRNPIADSGAPVKDSQGNLQGVVLVFRDQTEERDVQRERALLTNTIRASLDEIYLFHSETLKFHFVNEGALKNLGFSLEEMQSMTPVDIKPEIDSETFRQILQPLIDHTRSIQVFKTVHRRHNGSRYPVEVHLQLYEGDESLGEDHYFLAIIQDITERVKNEAEIRSLNTQLEQRVLERTVQLEASNKELEAFAYSISHDLRAPLRGIDGWSQALLEDNLDQLDERGRSYLGRVRSETQRMGSLIDDLLNLSRVTRSEMVMADVNLSDMALAVMARLRENDGDRQINFKVEPGLSARGDQRLLEIMLTNMLENAIKFTAPRRVASIEFGQTRQDDKAVFFIRDNGVGFNMAYTTKLFGAFQRLHKQTEFPGTGIGLATVQRIVHRHGGSIWTEAKPDEGATFYFTL